VTSMTLSNAWPAGLMGRWLGQGRKQGGFTLVEILVVVLILAIAAGVVIPQVIDSSDMQAISAARMIATDLQYAQNLAITTQKPVRMVFNPGAESYQLVYYDHTTNQSTAVEHPINKGSYTVSFGSLQGFGKLDLVSAAFTSNAYVEFNSIGAPDNAGQVVVQAGSQSCTIAVSAATGKVTVTTN